MKTIGDAWDRLADWYCWHFDVERYVARRRAGRIYTGDWIWNKGYFLRRCFEDG